MRDRQSVIDYTSSLAAETQEWLIAYYVNDALELLAADTVACGTISSVTIPSARLICMGRGLGATSFILVHNHPSGDPTPSQSDIEQTARLARLSREMELPLLTHMIVAKGGMREVGFW